MSLAGLLEARRRAILDDWMRVIAKGYPAPLADSLKKSSDRFANPIAGTLAEATASVFDGIRAGADRAELAIHLDTAIRLRAIQEFSPSEAVAFVFNLKGAVRRQLAKEIRKGGVSAEELVEFEGRIDEAGLVAFDAYMGCREQLMRLRLDEVRKGPFRAVRGATSPSTAEGNPSTAEGDP